jgi:hypothetical protein
VVSVALCASLSSGACDPEKTGSTFGKPSPTGSTVEGSVFFDRAPASGVLVKIGVESRLTDAAGAFRFDGVTASYDLVVEDEPGSFVVLPALAQRFVNVPVQRPPQAGAWEVTLRGELEQPLAPGHALTFLLSGEGVRSVDGPLERLTVRYGPDYVARARVHVVETEAVAPGALPGKYLSYGEAEVVMTAGAQIPFRVKLEPVRDTRQVDLTPVMPVGFGLESAVVMYDLGGGLTRRTLLATNGLPARVTLPLIPGFFTTRVAMRRGEETADSGIVLVGDSPVSFVVYPPASLEAPAASAFVDADTPFVVSSPGGVYEHELEPASGQGLRVRVVTDQEGVRVPWRSIGQVPPADAKYTWRVRRLGALRSVIDYGLVGLHNDAAQSLSAKREIVMRVPTSGGI